MTLPSRHWEWNIVLLFLGLVPLVCNRGNRQRFSLISVANGFSSYHNNNNETPFNPRPLLQELAFGSNHHIDGGFARPGIPLQKISSPSESLALYEIWKHGPKAMTTTTMTTKANSYHSVGGKQPILQSDSKNFPPAQATSRKVTINDNDDENDRFELRPELYDLMESTFDAVVKSMRMHKCYTELSPSDLNHGHVFVSSSSTPLLSSRNPPLRHGHDNTTNNANINGGLVGILFHCYEYPASLGDADDGDDNNKTSFLEHIQLGNGQVNSNCRPTLEEWRFRNVLWATWWKNTTTSNCHEGVMTTPKDQGIWLLDGKHPDVADLRVDGTEFGLNCPNTVWEGYLGRLVGDIIYDENAVDRALHCENLAHHEWRPKRGNKKREEEVVDYFTT